jgi:flagellar hook-associated protein 2
MRIGGLASGMDIDQLVGDLMKAERIPLDKIKQKKQTLEWQRDQYRDMNKLLNELQTMAKDMNYEKTYVSKKTTSSNEGAVSATGFPGSSSGTYNIKVERLATAAIRVSQDSVSTTGQKIDPNKAFKDQLASFKTSPDFNGGPVSFTLATFKEDGTKVEKTFEVLETETLSEVLKKINDSELGIRAFYDSTADKVVMERTVTGDFNKDPKTFLGAEIGYNGANAGFIANVLQMKAGKETSPGVWQTTETGGTNAKFTYNDSLTVEPSTNEYKINNIQFNLKQVTDGNETITVQTNTDAAFDSIVKFVNKYNEVIEKINGKLDEKRYRDYKPLSDEEKEAMDDKQIELWEEKAKSGLIRNDSSLSTGLNNLRLDFYEPLAGALKGFGQLAELGIKATSNYADKGKLVIDNEDLLKSKLAENPEAIYKLFSTDGDGKTRSTMGIAERLVKTIDSTIRKIEEKAGKPSWTNQKFTLGKNLNDVDRQINRFEDRLIQVEDRYWRQFTAMEKAIQRSNDQAMYLMQQFGGGQ